MDLHVSQMSGLVLDAIGVAGFVLYVVNYSLLTFNKITSQSHLYFFLNLAAASCVLISLTQSFNLASALIQMFWIVLSVTAIMVRLRPHHTTAP